MAATRLSPPRAAVDLTFEELYRGHRDDVYRAALRELGNAHDAEDVTQAAFVDAYRAVLRGTEPQSPRAWLLAISENVRRRRFRTAQRRPREETLDDADFPLAADLSYGHAQALAEALAGLSAEQRRVFVLREIVGLSYDEIAGEVDSTVASVQMLLFRARRSLRDELEPPTVAIQRTGGFLPPFPGWLAGLVSRVELTALTPRAAGVVGAAALTVAGVSVAVPISPAEGSERPASAAKSNGSRAAKPVTARLMAKSTARTTRKTRAASPTVMRAAPKAKTAPRSQPGATPTPTFVAPPAAPAAERTAGSPPNKGNAQPASEPGLAAVPVTVRDEVLPVPVEVPVQPAAPVPVTPVVSVPVTPTVSVPVPPTVSVPVPPTVSVPVPPVVSVAAPLPTPPSVSGPIDPTGAAGAAGASAPPLPVPSVPLPTLPPPP